MRSAIAALLFLAAVAASVATDRSAFSVWARKHGKVYTAAESDRRYTIWRHMAHVVERLNSKSRYGAKFALNKFSDLTTEEFASHYTMPSWRSNYRRAAPADIIPARAADSADYRYMLPAVKNQGSCGSCWAFSAVANMEAQFYQNNGGNVTALSEQQLVSCDTMEDAGCAGGLPTSADVYAVKAGMASEASYPYVSGTGVEPKCKKFEVVARFSDNEEFGLLEDDAEIIKRLRKYGPLSVGIEADTIAFQSYDSGVLDSDACGTSLDHGVAIVGFGTTAEGVDYWLVRNSWGDDWGEKGYLRMVRGKNMCGINQDLSTIKY